MRFKFKLWNILVILMFLVMTLNLSFNNGFAKPLMDSTYFSLSSGAFTQNWSTISLISVSDSWTSVNSIEGFRGDTLTDLTGADPQTILAADVPGVLDVNANQTTPGTYSSGGVSEFEITNPVVALQGSGTADAPYLKIYLDSSSCIDISVAYTVRDIDDAVDNAVQPVALQYRTGGAGNFTNVASAYIADATSGPSLATLETPINVTLPVNAENQSLLEIRIMTANAVGNDEWVGIDNINISATCGVETQPKINEFSANTTGTDFEYIEIYGEPDTDYSAFTLLEIEGDFSDTATGTIDEVNTVGTTDSNGFWLQDIFVSPIDNGTISLLLVKDFTGSVNDDLDTNDDGSFDVTPWTEIIDAIAVFDGDTADLTYGEPVLSANYDGLELTPGGASRIPDGYDTDSNTDWVRNDFDLAGIPGYTGSPILGEAYNTPGATNTIFIPPPEACGDPYTPIYDIQGSTLASILDGTEIATEGIVVADLQAGLRGFNIQDPTGDIDTGTSDGVFVFSTSFDVSIGDHVRVRGVVDEYNGLTEITSVGNVWLCSSGNPIPAPTEISLPVTAVTDFEKYEGMLVTFPQDLVISEYFNFDRFGEIMLTSTRHFTPTALYEPGSTEQAAAALAYTLDRITLDDGRSLQNQDPAIHPNGSTFNLDNLFRGGDLVTNVTGVMDYSFNLYRIQPTQGADYSSTNIREATHPEVGGKVEVASFNVLNYFTTLDTGTPICGPSQDMDCRGANTAEELIRQRDKIVAAISSINADVVGLMEIENNINDDAVIDLVASLNTVMGADTYDYINTGVIGTDAIKVAMIYKPASISLIGDFAILDSTVDTRFLDDKNRPVLAQSFQDPGTGTVFTVAVNHLKSKGSDCNDVSDPDLGDGAGNCNVTRENAALALVDWLETDPTNSGFNNNLIIGDLNSYDKEDPIDAIKAGPDDTIDTTDDYKDLVFKFQGEEAYGYVFDGQTGYLDHAMGNQGLEALVTSVDYWHINADEPDLIDYDMSFKLPAQDLLYAADAYRSSDHDPVIIGLDFNVFEISPEETTVFALPDTQMTVPITISNLGSLTDTYEILRIENDKNISIIYPAIVGPVTPGNSISFDVTIIIPEDELIGSTKTYTLQIKSKNVGSSLNSTIHIIVDYAQKIYLPILIN